MFVHQKQMLTAEELVRYRSRVEKVLPSVGSKEFNPTGSWLESKQIQSALDERKDLLQEERVEKICMLAEAVWDDELELARVTRLVGKHFETFGHQVNRVLFLYPEEALFLIENNHLELLYGDVAMSIQQGYSTLLSPNTDCTLDEYRVYSQLLRQGYKMLRHSAQRNLTRYERMIGLHHYIQPPREKRTRKEDAQKNASDKSDDGKSDGEGIMDESVHSEVKMETEKDVTVKSEDSNVTTVKSEERTDDRDPKTEDCSDGPILSECRESVVKTEGPSMKNEGVIVQSEEEEEEDEVMSIQDDADHPARHIRPSGSGIEEVNLSDEEMSSHSAWHSGSRPVECIDIADCEIKRGISDAPSYSGWKSGTRTVECIDVVDFMNENEVEVLDIDGTGDNASVISSSIQSTSSQRLNIGPDEDLCVTSTNNERNIVKKDNVQISAGYQICDSSVVDGSLENYKRISSSNNDMQRQSKNIQEITIDSTSPELMRSDTELKSSKDSTPNSPPEEKPLSGNVCRIKWYVKREPKPFTVSDLSPVPADGTSAASDVDCVASSGNTDASNMDDLEKSSVKQENETDAVDDDNSSQKTVMDLVQQTTNGVQENLKKEVNDTEILDKAPDENYDKKKSAIVSKDSSIGRNSKQDIESSHVSETRSGSVEVSDVAVDANSDKPLSGDKPPLKINLKQDHSIEVFDVMDDESSSVRESEKQNMCSNIIDVSDDEETCVKNDDSEIYVTDDEDDVNTKSGIIAPELIDLSGDEDEKISLRKEGESPECFDISDDSVNKSDIECGSQVSESMSVADDEVNDAKPVVGLEKDCHCDASDEDNDDGGDDERYSPAPINKGQNYYSSPSVYVPSKSSELKANHDYEEEFISLKTEGHCLEPSSVNRKRKYQDDEIRNWDKRPHRSDSQWESHDEVINLSDDENIGQNNVKRESMGERSSPESSEVKQETAPSAVKIEEELTKFYEEIEEINVEEVRKEVSEDRWTILDSFPNAYGQLVINIGVPPAKLLPKNVCPSKSHYLIPIPQRNSPPVQDYRNRHSSNYRNNWRGRQYHRYNHSYDHSRNRPRNMQRNFAGRGRNESEYHRNFGHQNMNEGNSNYQSQFNVPNQRQYLEISGMNDAFPEHQNHREHHGNEFNPDMQGCDPQEVNETNVHHERQDYQEMSQTDFEFQGNQTNVEHRHHQMSPGRHRQHHGTNHTSPGRRILHHGMNQISPGRRSQHHGVSQLSPGRHPQHQGTNQFNPDYRRNLENQVMTHPNQEQRRHQEHPGMNQMNPEHRRQTNSVNRRHLQHQGTPQHRRFHPHRRSNSTPGRMKPRGYRGGLNRNSPGQRRQFEHRGINQIHSEHQATTIANSDLGGQLELRGVNQTNPDLRRNLGLETNGIMNSGHWARNLTTSWSNADVSINYHHQTPALHAAQVAFNLVTQQFAPHLLLPTLLSSSQPMWLTPQIPQPWPQTPRDLDGPLQELRPHAPLPSVSNWGGEENCRQNPDPFRDTDERQLPFQRFARSQDRGCGVAQNRPQHPTRSQNPFKELKFKQPRYFAPPRKLKKIMEKASQDDEVDSATLEDENAANSSLAIDEASLSSPESSDDEEIESLVKPADCTSVGNILKKLQIIKSTNFENINTVSEISTVVVRYDLYLPDTVFRKANPSLPDFRLIILGFQQDFPSPGKMAALRQEYHDDVPFLLAIVMPDAITYFQYSVVTLPVHNVSSLNG